MNIPAECPGPDDCDAVAEHRLQIKALVSSHHLLASQIAELVTMGEAGLKRQDTAERRLSTLEHALDENTRLTEGIRDAITAGRVTGRIVKWAAAAIITVSSAAIAVKGLFDRGPP